MLPESRSTTYAPQSQIKSADLNALQDCIVEGAHGTKTLQLMPLLGIADPAADVTIEADGATWTAAAALIVSVPLHVGDRITAVHAWIREPLGDTTPLSLDLASYEMTGDLSAGGAVIASGASAGAGSDTVTKVSITGLTHSLKAGFAPYLLFQAAAAGPQLALIEIEFDHPLAP